MGTAGIYAIFDSHHTECLYVGLSRNIELRWKSHLNKLKYGNHPRKDFSLWVQERGGGSSCLSFQILEELPDDSPDSTLNIRERYWFEKCSPKFYGKEPSLEERWQLSENTKNRISEALNRHHRSKGTARPTVVCHHCGATYTRKKSKVGKYCSNRCRGAAGSKLSPQEVLEIQELLGAGSATVREIAAKYGVSHPLIIKISKNMPH